MTRLAYQACMPLFRGSESDALKLSRFTPSLKVPTIAAQVYQYENWSSRLKLKSIEVPIYARDDWKSRESVESTNQQREGDLGWLRHRLIQNKLIRHAS